MELYSLEGKVVGSVPVPKVLEGPVNRAVLWQAVRQFLANQRQGNADTKRRGEVRGGGRKPWKQKHTGRARAGSIRSPIWRKGGIVFGPHRREYRYELPLVLRRSALVHSLRAKIGSQDVAVVESLDGVAPKTKALALFLKQTKAAGVKGDAATRLGAAAGVKGDAATRLGAAAGGTLLVVEKPSPMLVRISRNIPKVAVRLASDLNCYEVLACRKLLVTSAALKQLEGLKG